MVARCRDRKQALSGMSCSAIWGFPFRWPRWNSSFWCSRLQSFEVRRRYIKRIKYIHRVHETKVVLPQFSSPSMKWVPFLLKWTIWPNIATNRKWPPSIFFRPKIRPSNHSKYLCEGFCLKFNDFGAEFWAGRRWRRSFPVSDHVRLQYGQIVHFTDVRRH